MTCSLNLMEVRAVIVWVSKSDWFKTLVPLFHPITMFSRPFLVSASCNYFELWLVHWIGSLCPLWLARVISLFLIFWHSTGHVWYINIPTWLRGFRDKLLYLVLFSLYPSLFWELRDKRSLKNLQFWPKSLGAMLEYWYIELGLLWAKPRNGTLINYRYIVGRFITIFAAKLITFFFNFLRQKAVDIQKWPLRK